MTTGISSHPALPTEVAQSVKIDLVIEFSHILNICVAEYKAGRSTVLLPENIQVRYGNTLLAFFQSTLAHQIGGTVNLECKSDAHGSKTYIQMRRVNPPPHSADQQAIFTPHAATSQHGPSTMNAVVADKTMVAATAKVPRPLNCWLHFRAECATKLYPDLPIQQACKFEYPSLMFLNFS